MLLDLERYAHHFTEPPEQGADVSSSSGFSGARIWQLKSGDQLFCARRWPLDYPATQLTQQHRWLSAIATQGCSFLACPLLDREGQSWQEKNAHLWQLEPWMAGECHDLPPVSRCRAALRALLRFQQASLKVQSTSAVSCAAIDERLERLTELHHRGLSWIEQATARIDLPAVRQFVPLLQSRLRSDVGPLRQLLQGLRQQEWLQQPCIRDVRAEHFFFDHDDQVRGLIDFGAMRIDSRVLDWSRFLQEFSANATAVGTILTELRASNHLQPAEWAMLPVLYRSSNLLAPLNWLRWLGLENRHFSNLSAVNRRFQLLCERVLDDEKTEAVQVGCAQLGL